MRRMFVVALVAGLAIMAFATPARATVHEIAGMWCAGPHPAYAPPGLTGGSNADNFAQPLFSLGFVQFDPFYDGSTAVVNHGPAPLVSFDFDHPASKIEGTGDIVFDEEEGIYFAEFQLKQSHGFTNCKGLR